MSAAVDISGAEWRRQNTIRHEHLKFCPIMREKCKGELCEWWDVTALECGIVAKGDDGQ